MAKSRSSVFQLLAITTLLSAAVLAGATDHIVGAHLGWNPNINYSLWSNNQTFYVGDLVSFRYPKNMQYNVFEVNKTGYDNCTLDSAVGNWSSGKDFILLDKPKTYYFICGNGFCLSGMKVAVRVHPLPTPPSAASRHTASSASSAAPTPPARPALLLGLAAAWIGIAIRRI